MPTVCCVFSKTQGKIQLKKTRVNSFVSYFKQTLIKVKLPQKLIIDEKMTVNILSNILLSLAVEQISDKCQDEHSRHKGHMSILSASSPHMKLLKHTSKSSKFFHLIIKLKTCPYFPSSQLGSKGPKKKNKTPKIAIGNSQVV